MLDHGVHQFRCRLCPGIEAGVGRDQRDARQKQEFKVFHMNETKWRFARHHDEFALLFQDHVGSAEQYILAVPVGDAAERAHGAGDDDHHVRRIGAAGEGGVHALQPVRFHAGRKFQTFGQFGGHDLLRVIAHHDMDLVLGRIEVVEQALRVKRAAGSGDGDKDFQVIEPFAPSMSQNAGANKFASAGKTS